MTKKKRAPGAGRPRIAVEDRRVPLSISMSPEHAAWLKGKKNRSLIVEMALDRYIEG